MKKIKIMPEYGCFPIWIEGADGFFENVSLETLEGKGSLLPKELKEAIVDWGRKYESTFNENYPPESGFLNKEDAEDFDKKGAVFLREISDLYKDYEVVYVSPNPNSAN